MPKQEYKDLDGNVISKNAWKKLQKRLKSQQARAEKDAKKAKQQGGQKKKKKKVSDEDMDPSKVFENRLNTLKQRKAAGEQPYPHKWQLTCSIPEFLHRYDYLENKQAEEGALESIAGRVASVRASGANLIFYDVIADGAKVQIMANAKAVLDGSFEKQHEYVNRGDIVGFKGYPTRTGRGELSLVPRETKLLAPCLHNIPSAKCPITDPETRYRQRYLDLIVTPKTREIFCTRAKIISYIRRFFDERGFLEVETPILNQVPAGANARPFLTKHNDLSLPMYCRIAPELALKMLVVGGLDRVYEIGRQFRNEAIDLTHNPEFTSCEFYWAYQDYNDLMDITEELISGMVYHIKGTYQIEHTREIEVKKPDGTETREKETITIDFSRPWNRFDMINEIESRGKMKIPTPYSSEECRLFLVAKCDELEIEVGEPKTSARMLDKLVEHFLEPECQNPAFIINHPQIMSPLAKYHRDRPGLTERLECFVAGTEIVNAYTEMNDAIVQREMFEQQAGDAKAGDVEAMPYDEDFCTAVEYGLPPTGGWGCGIDRITMFLTNSANIKEVLLFPQMKPKDERATQLREAVWNYHEKGTDFFAPSTNVSAL